MLIKTKQRIEKTILLVLIILGLYLMISGVIGILERDKQQTEYIKILEQSLQEQIQEKQVYMNMLEKENRDA